MRSAFAEVFETLGAGPAFGGDARAAAGRREATSLLPCNRVFALRQPGEILGAGQTAGMLALEGHDLAPAPLAITL